MHAITAPDIRHAPLALWRIAAAFLHVLHNLFGSPEELAARQAMTRKSHALIASWLRVGEALLRRLLLIEAAAIDIAPQATLTSKPLKRARKKQQEITITADNPGAWLVSFRCFASASDPRLPAGKALNPPTDRAGVSRFMSAWPLAHRYQAMLRVFNTPLAFARRLARRLRLEPHRLDDVLQAPPDYEHRVDRAEEITDAANHAWRSPDSS